MYRIISLILLSTLVSCYTSTPVAELKSSDMKASMTRGGCFGECPIYTISVFKGGMATLEAKRFTTMAIGKYAQHLPKKKYKEIMDAFKATNLYQYPDEYESLIPDLPLITLEWNGKNGLKKVRGRDNRPEALKALQAIIEELYTTEGWEVVETPEKPSLQPNKVMGDATVNKRNIVVQLKQDAEVPVFFEEMKGHKVKLISLLSKPQKLYLVSYDKRLDPDEVLTTIAKHRLVVDAQFDKPLQNRVTDR